MNCPDCKTELFITTRDYPDYFHIYEVCAHCGYVKAYVDYKDQDTGPLDYSGLDY